MSDPLELLRYHDQRPFRIAANCLYVAGLLGFIVIGLWKFAHWTP